MLGGATLVWRETDDLGAAVRRLSAGRVVASGVLAVVGAYLVERIWYALLVGLGVRAGARDAEAVFFVSQLGKYVPGSVWPLVAQMQFGRRWGAPRRVMLAAGVLLLGVVTASGIAVGAVLLPWSSPGGLTRYWWLLVLLLALLPCLHPRFVPAVLDLALRRLGREPLGVGVTGRGLAAAVAWSVVTWLVLGVHLLVLMAPYDGVRAAALAAATGGIAFAWAAGIAFVPAPAGAGVREGVLVLTLGPLVGGTPALAIALASRVLLLLADVLLAVVGALWRRVRPSPW
ncbi:lysylphosphatidylglycerol synthase domain-containing protein [Nocardioides cheoyonin]|uniref:lysylphosphatidylglycerol synthase domain-containing protein n=1 Tax=Nocardioides cheoyonin TaxID=3156615 RepID=UPI0032B59674